MIVYVTCAYITDLNLTSTRLGEGEPVQKTMLALAASWLLILPVAAHAADIIQITDNSYADLYPDISGPNVVWEAGGIYLWDGSTTTQLTSSGDEPAISGSNVVWRGGGIYLWDGTTTTQISSAGSAPDISGSNVVWEASDGNDTEIYFWDGATTTQLTDNSYDDSEPAISGSNVVWKANETWTGEIYLWDGDTTTQIPVLHTMSSSTLGGLDISGSNVVWHAHDGFDWEIYFWDGTTTTQLTDNYDPDVPMWDMNPSVSGSNVVWQYYNGYGGGITFLWDGSTTTQVTDCPYLCKEEMPVISGSNVVWMGEDGQYNYEIYMTTVSGLLDTDGDGISDGEDNCIYASNPNQCDFNQDGYGNRCDCDFSQNGGCGVPDYGILSVAWGSVYPDEDYDEQVDMDANGAIGVGDFGLFSPLWGTSMEGKSGLDCAGLAEGICPPVIGTCTTPPEP